MQDLARLGKNWQKVLIFFFSMPVNNLLWGLLAQDCVQEGPSKLEHYATSTERIARPQAGSDSRTNLTRSILGDARLEEGRSRISCDRTIQYSHCLFLVERCWNRSESSRCIQTCCTVQLASSQQLCGAGWELIGLVCVTVAAVAHEVLSTQNRCGMHERLHLRTFW